ncbi:aminotransferase class III-fold pyridoxal phosphate-dependent enzyme [Dactylosporangium sp. AC04546]|uniref:aspartate aminotransferase family protein n=1 Tax=Dactylosporangium sp. AC04546 TaxID=2862460 RepID=UPI001EE111B2|nr:aminotransferase class III-fold pyridoxal phosphate-dependent enzyme [Dactylosporangium sp. AC04546]WVK81047.1 aminotransferase class III-fold pyridoxal phosphate-dependent enzyme [Dactylosporangium sp. AC04546]
MTADQAVRPGTSAADLAARAAAVLPGGVSSNVRLATAQTFFERGSGPRLWDVDGNEYVDYLLGQGPAFLGHAHPQVNGAVTSAVARGMVFGAQHALEVEAVEKLLAAVGWADMARLGVSGTEAVQGALRLARAATGRRKMIGFAGQYHGWLDTVLMAHGPDGHRPGSAGQPPQYLADWVVAPFNDAEAVQRCFEEHPGEIAAVILEPMMCNSGAIAPRPGFLARLRELCTAHGAVLIFDEVVTGFRLAFGGATQRFGVTPDVAIYGKAVAGGWPVAAIAGRRELLELFGTGKVNHSGTFNASVMAAAAVSATMDVLRETQPYVSVEEHGTALMTGLRGIGERHGVPLHVQGLPAAFHVSFRAEGAPPTDVVDHASLQSLDLARYNRFSRTLAAHGIWVAGRGIWYVSAAHGPAELTDTLDRFDRALAAHVAEPRP